MAKKIKYPLGSVIAVPLGIGGYALGVIARAFFGKYGGCSLGYFYSKRYDIIPEKILYPILTPKKAKLILRFGDPMIRNGEWPVIGQIPNFSEKEWPMPHYTTTPSLGTKKVGLIYSDINPCEVISYYPINRNANLAPDGLHGYGVLVEILDDLVRYPRRFPKYDLQ